MKRELANIKSAKKRVKVIAVKTMRNKAVKSNLKTTLKKADAAVASKSGDSTAAIRLAMKKVDQAAARNIIHKNATNRKKSQLAKKLNSAKA
jgi:small subunit ribosomal protein S20